MTPVLYAYLLQHTRETKVLADLREATGAVTGSHMQVTPEQGQFLAFLVEMLGVQAAIEVGVFTGYSSLAIALALPANGRLIALDRDAGTMAMAESFWEKAGVRHKVDSRVGPALASLQQLLEVEGPGSFDFAFIDADKRAYWQYYELCLELLRPGGVIAVDNVLFYGKVANPEVKDKATVALRDFNARLLLDRRVTISTVPVGDGLALCRKRTAAEIEASPQC
ncbi:MAG: hypothetical protein WDW38_009436 [Sanguina aurantia]